MVHHDHNGHGPETSCMERAHKRAQLIYTQQMRERQYFMQELQEIRKEKTKQVFRRMRELIGPNWYQVLSVPQRQALDRLESAIYQDLLEGRPARTSAIMDKLGIYPRPNRIDLMNCNYAGRDDPKAMLAHLYELTYGYPIENKHSSYCLNARLMLTSILYLGLKNLIELLRERFKPDPKPPVEKPKKKPKAATPLASPYLQKMVAKLYVPKRLKKFRPAPLPDLGGLNSPYEEEPPVPKPPPPPPPPPPPKKRVPRSVCEKAADIRPIEPYSEITTIAMKTTTHTSQRQKRGAKTCVTQIKKTYGICITSPKKGSRRRKPKPPTTGLHNVQYMIQGVHVINGQAVFVLGSVSILPAHGELIHGGFRHLDGNFVNIHCGFRGYPPPPPPDPCDCLKKWHDSVFRYVKEHKCHCGHNYDFQHEGTFPPEELQYFQKPTVNAPYQFNYNTIYDIDEKRLFVTKEFKKIWETESLLRPKNVAPKDKKKKKKRLSGTCLGEKPKPEDYLKCALRYFRRTNLAARLPDSHLVPELREWMRRRLYGPYTPQERRDYLRRSNHYYQVLTTLALKGFGHIATKRERDFIGVTNWSRKFNLNKRFRDFAMEYRRDLFRSFADVNNLMWSTMYHVKFPDKKFREIFFSYLYGTVDDLQIINPYSSMETSERASKISRRRYICLPAGIEPPE